MIIGDILIGLAMVTAVVAALGYGLYYKNEDSVKLKLANQSYYLLLASLVLASGLLLSQILIHNFQINYVYSYSSRSLTTFYLISTFWAGQEGTFLLWTLISAFLGFLLIKKHAQKNPLVMLFLLMVNIFLLIILIKKNPFAMIWDVHKDASLGFMPADGSGLNPLLHNPWMVIHPPILFIGYASTVIPFAFAMSALVRRDFQNWVKDARNWIIFTILTLGTGIMLGAYWAYTTLGWGGYWGWDPVENSSLIPWLLSVALLHGVIIQNSQKGLVRTNLFLAGLSFIAMLWGSFLTRSGVLTDFSVHSFGESGLNMYFIIFIALFVGLFLFFYMKASKKIKSIKFAEGLFSRETFMLIGILSVLISAIFIFAGTSSPIFTGLVGKAANVSVNYYNTVNVPILVFLLFSAALAPILAWKVSELRNRSTVIKSALISLFLTIFAILLGLTEPVSIILFLLSVFAISLNSYVVFQRIRSHKINYGGYLTHVGIGLMMIGILTSSVYDTSEKLSLPQGTFKASKLGYSVKFLGFKDMPDGRNRVKLEIKTGEKIIPAEAQFYWSDYTKSYMVSPYVKIELLKDVYISPISYSPAKQQNVHEVVLSKGETKEVNHLNITFHDFEMSNSHSDPAASMVVKANVTVKAVDGDDGQSYNLEPEYILKQGSFISPDVTIPNQDASLKIGAIDASNGSIKLQLVTNDQNAEQTVNMLGVQISKKPLIIILWFGTLLAIAGIIFSLIYRVNKNR